MILKNSWNKDEERQFGLKGSRKENIFRKQINKMKIQKPKLNNKNKEN